MSLHNILVPNNNILYGGSLELSDQILIQGLQVPTIYNNLFNVPWSYNGVVQGSTLSCLVTRISTLDTPGRCTIHIPAFSLTAPSAGIISLDLSSFSGILIDPTFSTSQIIITQNNSLVSSSRAFVDGANQKIDIYSDLQTGNFTNSTLVGLPYAMSIEYIQAFA